MDKITTLGIDLAKNVFSLHGVDERGKEVLRKTLSRAKLMPFVAQLPPCLIGLEACSGAHEWARQFQAARRNDRLSRWAMALKERRGYHRAVVALAAKNARILWALMTRQSEYRFA